MNTIITYQDKLLQFQRVYLNPFRSLWQSTVLELNRFEASAAEFILNYQTFESFVEANKASLEKLSKANFYSRQESDSKLISDISKYLLTGKPDSICYLQLRIQLYTLLLTNNLIGEFPNISLGGQFAGSRLMSFSALEASNKNLWWVYDNFKLTEELYKMIYTLYDKFGFINQRIETSSWTNIIHPRNEYLGFKFSDYLQKKHVDFFTEYSKHAFVPDDFIVSETIISLFGELLRLFDAFLELNTKNLKSYASKEAFFDYFFGFTGLESFSSSLVRKFFSVFVAVEIPFSNKFSQFENNDLNLPVFLKDDMSRHIIAICRDLRFKLGELCEVFDFELKVMKAVKNERKSNYGVYTSADFEKPDPDKIYNNYFHYNIDVNKVFRIASL